VRFRLKQTFSAPLDDVARAFTAAGYYERLAGLPKLGRPEMLERQEDGDLVHLQVRYRFTGHLSAAARKVLDPSRLSWVEHATHDLARREVEFRMVPDHYGDRLRSSGRYAFSEEDGRTIRVVEGEVSVRVPLVGGAVERAIVSGLAEHMAEEVEIVERFLAEEGGRR
jgi:hypothetical protein